MVLLKVIVLAILAIHAGNVVESTIAKPGQFPFHVSIQRIKDKKHEHVCSGALINENFVLTAANCIYDNKYEYVVKTGVLGLNDQNTKDVQVVKIKQTYIHDDYKNRSFYNEHDIAILGLEEKVKLTKDVNLIDLPESKANVDKSSISTMIGYEFASDSELDRLKFFNTYIIENDVCKEKLKYTRPDAELFKSQFCVSEITDKNVYTIKGDSGDPLVQKKGDKSVLVGLAASYSPTEKPKDKSIFTQVSLYVDWINKKTGNSAFGLTYGYLVLIVAILNAVKNFF